MNETGFKVHYVEVNVGEGHDSAFHRLVSGHSVSLEPAIGRDVSKRAGEDFAKFLLTYADPEYIYALAEELYNNGYEFGG